MSGPDREYTLSEIIQAAMDTFGAELHVAIPGRVVKYDALKQVADIEPVCQQPLKLASGGHVHVSLPTFPEVPVQWPSGGGFFVSFPLSVGDPVMLIFSEVAMGEYLINAAKSKPVDTRRHSLGYPIAIPGGARPDSQSLSDASATKAIIGKDGAEGQIQISATEIKLGKTATEFVALASLVDTELGKIAASLVTIPGGPPATPYVPATTTAVLTKAK